MKHIFKCIHCNRFTMKETCGCGNKTLSAKPLRYTTKDTVNAYRRKAKLDDYKKKGLI